jgi:hypothetical protein
MSDKADSKFFYVLEREKLDTPFFVHLMSKEDILKSAKIRLAGAGYEIEQVIGIPFINQNGGEGHIVDGVLADGKYEREPTEEEIVGASLLAMQMELDTPGREFIAYADTEDGRNCFREAAARLVTNLERKAGFLTRTAAQQGESHV